MARQEHTDLTVIVVSYQTRDLTLDCLDSARRATLPTGSGSARGSQPASEVQLLVIDNASTDGSAQAIRERFADIELIESSENLGFARANNLAARSARGRYLLLLNPDTVVSASTFAELVAFADATPEAGIVGGRTTFADGALNPSSCWARPTMWSVTCLGTGLASLFRKSAWLHPESMGAWQRDSVRRVDIVSGCLLMIRRELWEELGGFDEDFFMYGEDTDLCLRAESKGWSSYITPKAEIVHLGGASERVRADKMVSLFCARARLYQKHWSAPAAYFGVRMLDLWALTRMLALGTLALLRPARRASFEAWRDIWRRRTAWANKGQSSSAATP